MRGDPTIRLVWIFAAVALAAGILLSAGAVGEMRAGRVKLGGKLAELEELRRMEREIVRHRAAHRAFGGLAAKRPVAMADLLKRHMEGVTVEDSRSTRQNTAPGWTIRRQELAFGEVSMDKVMELVQDAESGRPPWRLTRCIVRAAPGAGGRGKVDLVFEALDGE